MKYPALICCVVYVLAACQSVKTTSDGSGRFHQDEVNIELPDEIHKASLPANRLKSTGAHRASIGASIGVDKSGWLYLINLVEDGPAAKSKAILHGDRLVGIKTRPEIKDFAMVHELTREQIIDLIQGEEGTKITLWLLRDFKSYYVTLTREVIRE